MSWIVEGITPNITVNPHVIPSCLTIGHVIECIICKIAENVGKEGDVVMFLGPT